MTRALSNPAMNKLTAIILAAGESTRMRSRRPKSLHPLCGRPLIHYPVSAARALGARVIVVVGRGAEEVTQAVSREAEEATFVEQLERRGTGHAVLQAREVCGEDSDAILVLPGDMPLLSETTLRRLVERHRETGAAATLLTAELDDPTGYGRVIRQAGAPVAIVEHRDATAEQRAIREVGTSTYCFDGRLWPALAAVTPKNAQGEYYLTDVIDILRRGGHHLDAVIAEDPREGLGVNDRKQLAALASVMRARILDRLMAEGVTVLDPASTYVDDTVEVGADTVLYPHVTLEGRTVIGAECTVGPGCCVSATRLGDRVRLKPYCVLTDSVVGDDAELGPFCNLRPASQVGAKARIGNFVELKKSVIGRGAKVPHLSYVGDATLGPDVNIGAGTITCNYDGVSKHETVVGAGAFIGTNTSLVAPITVGEGAYIGAGSVITREVPPGALAVTRAQQVVKEGWAARKKKTREPKHSE